MHVKPIKRFGVHKGRSARRFRRDVGKTHKHNVRLNPMRGGYRL